MSHLEHEPLMTAEREGGRLETRKSPSTSIKGRKKGDRGKGGGEERGRKFYEISVVNHRDNTSILKVK